MSLAGLGAPTYEPEGVLRVKVGEDFNLLRSESDLAAADIAPAVIILAAALGELFGSGKADEALGSFGDGVHEHLFTGL